jgi:hypothetical protein
VEVHVALQMAILFVSPLGNDRDGWKKNLNAIHTMGYAIHLINEVVLC